LQQIITPRLFLRLMTADFLEASFNGDAKRTESLIGLKISQDWFDENDLSKLRLDDYRRDAEYISWGLRAIGLKESNQMIGFIGFHSRPNPEYLQKYAPQAIEFGYTIFFQNRRQGFAEEALIGLMKWAVGQYPLENFIASVSPKNIPSTRMIKKLEFEKIAEQIDETDGLEFVYQLPVKKLKSL
jgi:ribosomal-protein-alanine N-acetyltransferase